MQVQDEILETIQGWFSVTEAESLQIWELVQERFPRGLPRNVVSATGAINILLRGGVFSQLAYIQFLNWLWCAVTDCTGLAGTDTVYVLWDDMDYRSVAMLAGSLPAALDRLLDLYAPMAIVPHDVSWCLFFTMIGDVRFSYLNEIRRGKE